MGPCAGVANSDSGGSKRKTSYGGAVAELLVLYWVPSELTKRPQHYASRLANNHHNRHE